MQTLTSAPRRQLLVAVGVCLALAGCTGDPDEPPTRIVVVTAPTAEQPQPGLGAAEDALIRAAAETDAAVLDVVVAGDPGATRHIDLTPRRELGHGRSEVEHGPARAGLVDEGLTRIHGTLAALAPADGVPDLLGAITEAARMRPAGTLVVADSGITTVDPVDLGVLGWDQDPKAVVDDLARRGFLPDLRGWSVRFTALGRVAGDQPALPAPQLSWLESFWSTLCTTAGATSCAVSATGPATGPPLSTRHATPVPVPDVTTIRGRAGSVTTLPASRLGFTEGSWNPGPGADRELTDVVAAARDGRHAVEVVGYVAYWGSEQYRAELSTRRAGAVADLLVAAGVPAGRVTAVGLGAGDGPAASLTSGRFDEAKVRAAGLRRVVITVRPVDPS